MWTARRKNTAGCLLVALGVALGGCSDPEGSSKKAKAPAASRTDPVKARTILYEGEELLKKKKYAEARTRIHQAEPYADTAVYEEIRIALGLVDESEAKVFAPDIKNTAEAGKCEEALDDTVTVIERGSGIALYIRKQTGEAHSACIVEVLGGGDLARVRKILESDQAKKALDGKIFSALETNLEEAVTNASMDIVGEPLQAHDFKGALAKIDEFIKAGKGGDQERGAVLELVRKGILDDVAKLHEEGMASPKATKEKLAAIDELLKIGWTGEQQPPEAALTKKKELSFWMGCSSIKCKPSEPQVMWLYGHNELLPLMDPRSKPAGEKLKHGTKVWKIAEGGGMALIALKNPGKLAEGIAVRLEPASGWIKESRLRAEDTRQSMPPLDSLAGVRVWGPLREGQTHYELGTVVSVDGHKAKVRRLTDRQEVEVPVRQLHFGLIKKGTKLLAACTSLTKLEPATIDEIKETHFEQQGDPLVDLTCLDADGKPTGKKLKGQLASTRMDPKWLK